MSEVATWATTAAGNAVAFDDLDNRDGVARVQVKQNFRAMMASIRRFYDASGAGSFMMAPRAVGLSTDAVALQAVLDACAAAGGGTVQLWPQRYLFDRKVTIPQFVRLRGAGWLPDPSNGAVVSYHTAIGIDWGAGADNHAIEMSFSSAIEGVSIHYPSQVARTAATPVAYGYAISTPTAAGIYDNISIRNVTLLNPYKGIRLVNGGRWRVQNVQGNPLFKGFYADAGYDACYMENVHFWNFYTQSANLEAWVVANCTAFAWDRVDQLFASKLFAWNVNIAFNFGQNLWANFTDILADKANYPAIVENVAHLKVLGATLIGQTTALPAVWLKSGLSTIWSGMRITSACSGIGFQIDATSGTHQVTNSAFQNPHFAAVVTSTASSVRFSNCTWSRPPQGSANVMVDGEPLAASDTAITLPATYATTNVVPAAGVYTFDLSTLGDKIVSWDFTSIGQRNSLFVLEFDYELVGTSATWYGQILLAQDTGSNVMVDYAALAPIILNGTSGAAKRVRIQVPENGALTRQLLTVVAKPTVVVGGASLKLSNFALYEQTNRKTTDAQVAMMLRQGYNSDGYSLGQTLFAKGVNRRVFPLLEPGIGRSTPAPTTGTWIVGDEMMTPSPASAGFMGYICTTAGTPGTWKTWGLIS